LANLDDIPEFSGDMEAIGMAKIFEPLIDD
jgi:hypothetical protein